VLAIPLTRAAGWLRFRLHQRFFLLRGAPWEDKPANEVRRPTSRA